MLGDEQVERNQSHENYYNRLDPRNYRDPTSEERLDSLRGLSSDLRRTQEQFGGELFGAASQGTAALGQATQAQRVGAASLARTMGGPAAYRAASPGMAAAGQAGVAGGRVVGQQDEMARRALLAQLAGQGLEGDVGMTGVD